MSPWCGARWPGHGWIYTTRIPWHHRVVSETLPYSMLVQVVLNWTRANSQLSVIRSPERLRSRESGSALLGWPSIPQANDNLDIERSRHNPEHLLWHSAPGDCSLSRPGDYRASRDRSDRKRGGWSRSNLRRPANGRAFIYARTAGMKTRHAGTLSHASNELCCLPAN